MCVCRAALLLGRKALPDKGLLAVLKDFVL
jgi:hypothetical protein